MLFCLELRWYRGEASFRPFDDKKLYFWHIRETGGTMFSRLFLLMAAIFMGFGAVTYLLHRVFNNNRLIKYVPALATMGAAFFNLYLARTAHNGFEDLARFMVAMMLFTGAVAAFVTGLIIDFIIPRFKR